MCYPIWIAPFRRLCGKTAQPVCHDRIPARGQLQTHVRVDFVVSLQTVGGLWYIFVRRFDRTTVRFRQFDVSAAVEVEMGETALVRGSDVVGSPEVVGGSAGISNSGLGTRRRGTSQVVPDSVAAREM